MHEQFQKVLRKFDRQIVLALLSMFAFSASAQSFREFYVPLPGGVVEKKSEEEIVQRDDSEADISDVLAEMTAMRADMARMQEMLDLVLNDFVLGMKNETMELREEVKRLRAEIERMRTDGTDFLNLLPSQIVRKSAGPELPAPDPDETIYPEDSGGENPVRYSIIKEWGRDAEQAKRLNNASSLKGMICAVPPGYSKDQLENFGRWLRNNFESYDNININVFTDIETAEIFAATNRVTGKSHVLNISKHRATGHDKITLFQKGVQKVVPRLTPENEEESVQE